MAGGCQDAAVNYVGELNVSSQSILEMVAGEERRWQAADQDKDGSLNIVEFQSFLHPETDRRMEEVVLSEIMEDMDLDQDERISLEEYITDMVSQQDEESSRESERVNFRDNIDLDNNGYLDRAEVQYQISEYLDNSIT